MKRRLIIFDFDGTLADTFSWFVNVFDEVADKHQFRRLDRANLNVLRGLDARRVMLHHQVPFWKLPLLMRHMRSRMKRDIADIALFPGIEDALRELSEKEVILAIVSSNARANVLQLLGPENAARFSYFECGTTLFGKSTKLRRILALSQTTPDTAILIGDEIRDAQAAREAGISFGAVAWGYTHIDALISHGAQEVFFSVGELHQKLMS